MTADLLRRAADVVEEFAKGATEGPWNGHTSDRVGYAAVYGGPFENGYRMGSVMGWSEEVVEEYGGEPSAEDLRWLCLMSPHLAGPLAAWFRAAAAAADSYPHTDGVHARIMRSQDQPAAYRHTLEFIEHASAAARAILGEES